MRLSATITQRLETQHQSLAQWIPSMDQQRLLWRPAPGKWHIKDHLAHLTRYQQVFSHRLDRILQEDTPRLGRYRAEDDPEFEPWRSLSAADLIDRLAKDRGLLREQITELDQRLLGRKGIHPVFGMLTVVQWCEFFLLHEAHHLYAIFRIKHQKHSH